MNSYFRRLSVVFATGYAVAIAAQFVGLVSFHLFSLPILIGGLIGSGLVALVISDYSRRPSFRVRRSRRELVAAPQAAKPAFDDPTLWTYTTRSA